MQRLAIVLLFCSSAFAQLQPAQTETADAQRARIERMEKTLKDWPNLARYAEANAALPAPAPREHRVVFMGDSITDGWKLGEYFPGKPYVNRGISGQTTPQMLIAFVPTSSNSSPRSW